LQCKESGPRAADRTKEEAPICIVCKSVKKGPAPLKVMELFNFGGRVRVLAGVAEETMVQPMRDKASSYQICASAHNSCSFLTRQTKSVGEYWFPYQPIRTLRLVRRLS
jgi:hypothetical protein